MLESWQFASLVSGAPMRHRVGVAYIELLQSEYLAARRWERTRKG